MRVTRQADTFFDFSKDPHEVEYQFQPIHDPEDYGVFYDDFEDPHWLLEVKGDNENPHAAPMSDNYHYLHLYPNGYWKCDQRVPAGMLPFGHPSEGEYDHVTDCQDGHGINDAWEHFKSHYQSNEMYKPEKWSLDRTLDDLPTQEELRRSRNSYLSDIPGFESGYDEDY